MRRLLTLFIASVSLFSVSCDLLSSDDEIPEDYPTTLKKLLPSQIDSLSRAFINLNGEDLCIKFTEYGLIDFPLSCNARPMFEIIVDNTRMVDMAKSFLLKNKEFTGINDTTMLGLPVSSGLGGRDDVEYKLWGVFFGNQRIDGLEVLRSEIWVYLNSEGVYGVGGSWYRDIVVPPRDRVSSKRAKQELVGYDIKYWDWGGEGVFEVTGESIHEEVEKFILPVINDGKLELRVVWRIIVGEPSWYVFVDTSTGEAVLTVQRWIS